MLTPKESKMLAIIRQIAIYNLDLKMANKIENITKSSEITPDIKNYKLKEDVK